MEFLKIADRLEWARQPGERDKQDGAQNDLRF
jgi:hypothetical protein